MPLLERDEELEQLARATRAAPRAGAMIAIGGPPGCGKTALLELAARRAQEAGMAVFSARGREPERGFGFGAARQLFERHLAGAEGTDREALRRGAATIGWAALGLGEDPPGGEPAALHGLYWLLVELTERAPVLLAIDDAQWLDQPTLRWLGYVTHRLAELPVLVVLTARDSEGDPPAELNALLADPTTSHLAPAPLSEAAIGRLLELRLGAPAGPGFVAACRRASAGNAFVAQEMIGSLAAARVDPTDAAADLVADVRPANVIRWLQARLERTGPDAVRLARALAIAGEGVSLGLLATVAELPAPAAADAADALVAADLVRPERPWRFAHDLVRGAVEAEISPAESSAAHRRCAEAMTGLGADPEAIAVHWLSVEPGADAIVVEQLREAARRAIGRGDPGAAVRALRRALAEGGSPPPGFLHELGRAELFSRDPACLEHLTAALAAEDDPRRRAEVGIDASDALLFSGRWKEALALNRRLREDLDDDDPLAFSLDAFLGSMMLSEAGAEEESDLTRLRGRAAAADPAARPLCLQLACLLALRAAPAEDVVALVDRGYADGGIFEVASSDSATLAAAVMALIFVERYQGAGEIAEGMLADARHRGLVLGYVAGTTHRGLVARRAGELRGAEADLRDAFALALEHELDFTLPFIAGYLASTLLERGYAVEAAEVLGRIPPPDRGTMLPGSAAFHDARGDVRAATGDHAGAVADLRAVGEAQRGMRSVNPLASTWRSRLAVVLGAGGEAIALAEEELALAEAIGAPGAIGVATHALALIGEPDRREERLRLAVDRLAASPARVEHARARVDLGTVLRQKGAREEAREHVLIGLDLADRSGASVLAERARAEAVTAGARPRRAHLSGAGALTPAELRVARLAAEGMTNRQIAQSLFITLGTVKDHLGSCYRKLAIGSRDGLAGALRDQD